MRLAFPQNVLRCGQLRPQHCAQNAPGQLETCKLCQDIRFGGEDGNIAAPGDHIGRLAVNVFAFHQKGYRLAAGIQRPVYDLGTFGDEHTLGWLKAVEQLRFGKSGIDIQRRIGEIRNFNDVRHDRFLCLFFSYSIKGNAKCQKQKTAPPGGK